MKKLGVGCLALIGAGVVLVVILGVVFLASLGGGDDGGGSAGGGGGAGTDQAPRSVAEGAKFTIGKYTVAKGWKIGGDGLGGWGVKNVSVKNTSQETDTVFFTMKVLQGSKVLASIECNTTEMEPGQSQDANCVDLGSGKFVKGKHKITVESSF